MEAMTPWLEAVGVLALSGAGIVLGFWFSRRPKFWWMLGYFLPLILIVAMGLARRFNYLEVVPPFAWLMAGRMEFALTGLLATMIFSTLLPRVPRKSERVGLIVLMALAIITTALPPFVAPIFNRAYLESLETKFDMDGVCRQSNDYSCGPAAAVTALRSLGVRGEEGEIAILARTTRWTGTEPDMMTAALRERFAPEGIKVDYQFFKSVDELRGPFVTIARIKFSILLDHYVTVLKVTDDHLLVADPMSGLKRLSHEEFANDWRYCGVTLERTNTVSEKLSPLAP